MRNTLAIFILLANLGFGVSKSNDDYYRLILGNWNTCHKDGRYSEFYISDSIIEYTINDDYPLVPFIYQIITDTIILKLDGDTAIYGIWRIQKVNNNEILLIPQSDTLIEIDTTILIRIKEEIILDSGFKSLDEQLKWYKKYYTPYYNKRWKAKNCKDMRSEKEKEEELKKIYEIELY